MGYCIAIGDAKPYHGKEDNDFFSGWDVGRLELVCAPEFPNDEMTGKTNIRRPSYTQWAAICREAGIYELFFDESEGLFRDHPGCKPLKQKHLDEIRFALDLRKRKSKKRAGFFDAVFNEEKDEWEYPEEHLYDGVLACLIWLEFWVNWALSNCENPAIANS